MDDSEVTQVVYDFVSHKAMLAEHAALQRKLTDCIGVMAFARAFVLAYSVEASVEQQRVAEELIRMIDRLLTPSHSS